jgi:hypothetical protein
MSSEPKERTVGLVHKHGPKMPKFTGPWVAVSTGQIGISKTGKTPIWSGSFQGCIGVVMCGTGPWGAMAHLHQQIQITSRNLELALSAAADFVRAQTKGQISDVLLYYGDAPGNTGKHQGTNLTEARVKEVMKCQKVIDLRRKDDKTPYGADFVYDPGLQTVYTATGAMAVGLTGLDDLDAKELHPVKTDFPYKDGAAKKVLEGMGNDGCFFVP